jgi:hypothetical protein
MAGSTFKDAGGVTVDAAGFVTVEVIKFSPANSGVFCVFIKEAITQQTTNRRQKRAVDITR